MTAEAPLVSALRKGLIGTLVLVVPGNEACMRFELSRSRFFRFWRPHRTLDFHFSAR